MKRARLFAWLLIVAMLTVACPAFGDELTIGADEDPGLVLEDGIAVEVDGDAVDPDLDAGDLSLELTDLDLADGLTDLLSEADEGGLSANGGDADSLTGVYYPTGTYDNDALFAGYVDMLFGKADPLGLQSNGWVGDRLTGASAKAYNYLLDQFEQVAAGTLSSTEFTIPSSVLSESQAVDVYYDFPTIVDALLVDCPYQLFWYDKTNSTPYGVNNGVFYTKLPVAQEFAKGLYKTNVKKIKSAATAAANAKAVVNQYAGASDYNKLCAYRDYICDANTYNDDAADDPYWPYGNPWQLIWVFDGDSSTNVVCEGYAKAFQYLCDLSYFSSAVQCHIVSGAGGSASSQGPHMWNVVTMGDGKNYHTDITFVDSDFPEAFLAGAVPTGYGNSYCVGNLAYYQFDNETLNTYPAATLKLSTTDYDPNSSDLPVTETDPTGVTIVQGNKATLYMGSTLPLRAVVEPSNASTTLTWSSNKTSVATVNSAGVVMPKKAGTAKITVRTHNGKSATITIKVVDVKSVKLMNGSKTLKKGQTIKMKRGQSLTLKAVVSPVQVETSLTWRSSNKSVTVNNGRVTVKSNAKPGTKAKITVKTANRKSTYIYIAVR